MSRSEAWIRQLVLFFGVGALATAAHYLALLLLVRSGWSDPVAATSAGYAVGAVVSYYLNYTLTFRSNSPHVGTIARFSAGTVLGFLVNAAVMWLGTQYFALDYMAIQLVATGLVFFLNFAVSKTWTFKQA